VQNNDINNPLPPSLFMSCSTLRFLKILRATSQIRGEITSKFSVFPGCDPVHYERNIPTFQKPNDRGVPKFHRQLPFGKGKAEPLQASSGPEGSRKLIFPDFMTTAQ
jgi:hypothetical protein